MVPRAGVEPARPFEQRILSPQRLPFRHPGMLSVSLVYQAFPFLNHQYLSAKFSNIGGAVAARTSYLRYLPA